MALHLIAATSDPSWTVTAFYWLMVLVGVNLIILVHEFGHFVVARWCGVRCDKFYVWFDIFGWKLFSFRCGETEYGLGVLPLGGYVKMLGQEDNPARLREELARAKAQQAAGLPPGAAAASANPGGSDSPALYDPRSYLAQSVPKRMAIISAGVIMNVLFAFVAAAVAYPFGVRDFACVVGSLVPGKGAWQADLKTGDEILKIADKPVHTFTDLKASVSLGDVSHGVKMLVRRPGVPQPFEVNVLARPGAIAPEVGILPSRSTSLHESLPLIPGSAAARAQPAFRGGDRFVAIDGVPVASYADILAQLARCPEKPLSVAVWRETNDGQAGDRAAGSGGTQAGQELAIEVPPAPMRWLGIVMEMGPIDAIQSHSPAAQADLRPGDQVLRVDGQPVAGGQAVAAGESAIDPMTLPDRLRRLVNDQGRTSVVLTLARAGQKDPILVEVPLREVQSFDTPLVRGSLVSVPALGIAYRVYNRVHSVMPGGPADKAGVKAGDVVASAKVIPPDKKTIQSQGLEREARELDRNEIDIELGNDKLSWPFLLAVLQQTLPGTKVELELERGESVTLDPVLATDWFNPDRGLFFGPLVVERRAESVGEAVRLGLQETLDSMLLIYRTLNKLGTGQVSPKGLIGPVGIVEAAYTAVEEGPGQFLLFLCLISANLAVINFLPIPVLDGGHMVFLAYEGIRGKPPSEGVLVALSYLGLALILLLMVWVVGLDVGCIPRH